MATMKLFIRFCSAVICLMSLLPTGATAQDTTGNGQLTNSKILIVYLSRTNNTRAVAQMIHDRVGGNLVALELKQPYPEDYQSIVQQVGKEISSGYLPPLQTQISNMEQYDTVFIGFPTWAMQLPPPIKSFLSAYNLKGKTVIPFNTHGGYGVGSGFRDLKAACTGCKVLEGFSTKGGIERDGVLFVMEGQRAVAVRSEIDAWLKRILQK